MIGFGSPIQSLMNHLTKPSSNLFSAQQILKQQIAETCFVNNSIGSSSFTFLLLFIHNKKP